MVFIDISREKSLFFSLFVVTIGVGKMTVQILIVEDDIDLRDQYRTLIRERNSLSLAAETDSVEEALRILQAMEIEMR